MLPAQNGKMSVIRLLKKAGCDMEEVDDLGNNILHVACIGGFIDIVKYVLSLTLFDINRKGESGKPPVMIAAFMGHEDVFYFLLGKGCGTSGVDASDDNILHLACLDGSKQITNYIVKTKLADINTTGALGGTPVMKAAGKGYSDLVQFLINKGCDLNAFDGQGNNVLYVACLGGSLEVVKHIISQAIVETESKGNHNWTPIMMAAEQGHYEVFKFQADEGCKLTHEDPFHNTIFHLAAIGGNEDIVKYLLEKHVPGTKKANQFGSTPYDTAVLLEKESVANLVVPEA